MPADFLGYRQNNFMAPVGNNRVNWGNFNSPLPEQEIGANPQEEDQTIAMLRSIYAQPGEAMQMYKQHLEAMPQRQPQGKFAKLMAGLAGASAGWEGGAGAGYNTTRSMLDAPYERSIADYRIKAGNLGELANLESADTGKKTKLLLDIEEQKRKTRDESRADRNLVRQEKATNSTISYNSARMADLAEAAKLRGLHIQKNEVTGESVVVDLKNPTAKPITLAKFAESIPEKDNRELGNFKTRNLFSAGTDRTTHSINAGVNRKTHEINRLFDVANPVSDSGGYIPPSQSKNARDLAIEELANDFPGFILRNANGQIVGISKTGQNDSLVNRKGVYKDPKTSELWQEFDRRVKTRAKEIESKRRNPLRAPTVDEPKTSSLRDAAIEELTTAQQPITEPNIAEVMRQLQGEETAETPVAVETPPSQPIFPNTMTTNTGYTPPGYKYSNPLEAGRKLFEKFSFNPREIYDNDRGPRLKGNLPSDQR